MTTKPLNVAVNIFKKEKKKGLHKFVGKTWKSTKLIKIRLNYNMVLSRVVFVWALEHEQKPLSISEMGGVSCP